MRTIKTYSKGAPFYNAFLRRNPVRARRTLEIRKGAEGGVYPAPGCDGVLLSSLSRAELTPVSGRSQWTRCTWATTGCSGACSFGLDRKSASASPSHRGLVYSIARRSAQNGNSGSAAILAPACRSLKRVMLLPSSRLSNQGSDDLAEDSTLILGLSRNDEPSSRENHDAPAWADHRCRLVPQELDNPADRSRL